MSSDPTTLPPEAPATAPGASLSILVLAVAAFVIVTTEFLIVGLLPALARDLQIPIALAGQLVTLFAFTVMLFGPPLTVLLSHLDRKRLFIAILLIFAASNALAALAPNVWVLALARVVPALVLPVFWGTASETAAQIVGPARAGQAVSKVYLGISAALLFGIPLGTLAAEAVGWRSSFWGLAALSLAMAAAMHWIMPALARPQRLRIGAQTRILRDPRFVGNVLLSVVVFTAMFGAYTYLADTLERLAGVAPRDVGWWLMGFGTIGLVGNWLGGRFVDRHPLRVTAAFAAMLAVGMVATALTAGAHGPLMLALAVWGIAHTALFPVCQVRVMAAGASAQALAGTLNVSAANAGIGLGAILGGLTIEHLGLARLGFVAAAVACLAVVAVPLLGFVRKSSPAALVGAAGRA